jgi:hypothetical protein
MASMIVPFLRGAGDGAMKWSDHVLIGASQH